MKSRDRAMLFLIFGAAAATLVPTTLLSLPAALALTLWLPGRSLLRLLGWDQDSAGRGWLALAASIVLMPLPLSWVWGYSNNRWLVGAVVLAVNLVLCFLASRRPAECPALPHFVSSGVRRALGLLVLFVGVCVFGTIWLPQAVGRLNPSPIGDYVKHHAVLLSLERYPLPLHNIFYAQEADTPYYYYQYHHHLAAGLHKLTGDSTSIPLAFALTSALTAMALVVVTFLLAREFLGRPGERGAFLAAACVSVVGGWDIIPTLIRMAYGAGSVIILDSWSSCPWRLHNVMTQFVWCPQHVAATLALVLAARWLRCAPCSAGWIGLGPALAASIFGSSVHLAMTVFTAAAVYVLLRVWPLRTDHARLGRLVLGVVLMALLGAALMAAQARGYDQMSERIPGGLTTQWDRFEYAFLGRLISPGPLANYLDAPWILLIDFGLPAVACLLAVQAYWRRVWRDDGLRLLLLAGILGILTVFTVRSNHSPFDYAFRIAILPMQVLAAITVGALVGREFVWSRTRRYWPGMLAVGVVLGLPVGFYEAPLMTLRTLLQPASDRDDHDAYRFLRDRTPPGAVVQGDPTLRERLPQLTNRRIGVMDFENSHVRVFYPLDMPRMMRSMDEVREALATTAPSRAYELLRRTRIEYVLAGSVERAQYGPQSQFDDDVWFECVYRDAHARVYRLREHPSVETGVQK